jgi:hypothetical protein
MLFFLDESFPFSEHIFAKLESLVLSLALNLDMQHLNIGFFLFQL